ncbi:ISAs1 family transposase [Thiocystis violacea]|uniref:ISAs1 family transposase n=1 Tax=Thiocystis violacea TaxID=13725 RepID=UPI0019064F08|nr:ISAs1 family transposase [Thiocystis violacea]MBK1720398.1 ISAs1 family transposase [Thiocystis violacea]
MSASFLEHFAPLQDPRMERNQRHALLDIVLLVVCAVVSGADGWEAIEEFGREKLDWLRAFARFANGVPSHDCIANVVSRLTPKGFGECFRSWTQAVAESSGGQVVAVDGKRARGSRDRRRGRSALHMVSAWACSNRLVLGQEATEEKSNEITAIPKRLEFLELTGCIVTIDAMGCQRAIAAQIIAQGGDSVLGLKGNQSALQERVEDVFDVAAKADFSAVGHDFHQEIDKDHGRLEVRRDWVTEDLRTVPDTPVWTGLRSIGMVERHCTIGTTETVERRYFINSIPAQAARFANAVRGHWGVENRLHWRLDVIFGDDASRLRKGNAPAIMTTIRHLCLNLFEQEPSKLRLSQKRRKAAWNDDYRAKVVFGQ